MKKLFFGLLIGLMLLCHYGNTMAMDIDEPIMKVGAALSGGALAAGTGSGIVVIGASLTAEHWYYMASDVLTMAQADAAGTTPAICLAISTTQCMTNGVFRLASSPSWTLGTIMYLSITTAGHLQTTAPSATGNQVQRLGVAIAADVILVAPSMDIGEVK